MHGTEVRSTKAMFVLESANHWTTQSLQVTNSVHRIVDQHIRKLKKRHDAFREKTKHIYLIRRNAVLYIYKESAKKTILSANL